MPSLELSVQEVREALTRVSVANISDAMHGFGTLRKIRAIDENAKLVGPAQTVSARSGDWADVAEAVDTAHEGEVLVIDAGGAGPAVWGELATHSALQRRLAGVVVYGAVRDILEIKKLGFPVFCRSVVPDALRPKGKGEIGRAVTIAGVAILPGDWIIGDSSGVVCIPQSSVADVVPRAMRILEKEDAIRERIDQGSTLWREMGSYWRDELSKIE